MHATPETTRKRSANVLPFRATVAQLDPRSVLVSVSGELDLYAEPSLRESLDAADRLGVTSLLVDLSGVSFLDSTICGVLVGEAKRRSRDGGELVLVSNGAPASRALELAGIDRVVRVFPTLHSALTAQLAGKDN